MIPLSQRVSALALAAALAALALIAPCSSGAAGAAPELFACEDVASHAIDVTLDIKGRFISGTDVITFSPARDAGAGCTATLYIREGSKVDSIRTDGAATPDGAIEFTSVHVPEDKARRVAFTLPPGASSVTVGFSGAFDTIESTRVNIKRGVAFVGDGVVGPEGALLLTSALWHPQDEDSMSLFDLRVTVPAGYTAIAEGERTELESGDGVSSARWVTGHPSDGINLVVGRYITTREDHGGVAIYTFFFERDEALSRTYIDKTKEYLDLYGELLGPYPFKKFAVVENFLPTGYGMPSYTLLGSGVLRLPFLPDTSLGHEIAHSWWGNSVYNSTEGGNWVEALTTYVSDYMYERRKGADEARGFRQRTLQSYKSYSTSVRIPLAEFTDAETPASRVVGYNKGVMVLGMLEDLIGEEAFNTGLRELYTENAFSLASWDDIRAAFEAASGEGLGWFFDQWLTRVGGPELSLRDAVVTGPQAGADDQPYAVTFTVAQGTPPYRLFIPVVFTTEEGMVARSVMVSGESDTMTVRLGARPIRMELDPDHTVFRIMGDTEIPPSLGGCFGDSSTVIVMPNRRAAQKRYFKIAELLRNDYGHAITTDAEIARKDYLSTRSLVILGGPGENLLATLSMSAFEGRLAMDAKTINLGGKGYSREDHVVAVAARNPHDPRRTYCLVMAGAGFGDDERVFKTARRVRYYSQKGFIVIGRTDEGGGPATGTFEGGSPLSRDLPPGP